MARSVSWIGLIAINGLAFSGCAFLPSSLVSEKPSPDPELAITSTDHESTDATKAAPVVSPEAVSSTEPETASAPQPNYFSEGVTRAQSAVAIGQSAQSANDWTLAASRWQQAVSYMQQVPGSDPNYATAQQKVKEYQQNLALAERRAAGEVPNTTSTPATTPRPDGLVTSIPVVGQMGGTPVVPVTLTGNSGTQQFTMLFDTGASGTLITQAMADAVGVLITGSATVTVADGRRVEMPVGYVDTLQVGDLVIRDIWVGIGGDVALLGQDVYGKYGLSIGGNRINLYQ